MRHLFSQSRVLGGAAVLAGLQFGASLVGLFRDRILAKTFPGLDVVDVYIAAFRPSDLLFQVCIMSAFSVALVPLLAKYKGEGSRREMHTLLSSATAVAFLVFAVVALLLAALLPRIAPLLTQFQGESLVLYIQFARLALLTNALFVFGSAFGQYLLTEQRYWIYGITPMLYSLGTILGTVYLTPIVGPYGPILGSIGGACIYALLRLFAVLSAGFRPKLLFWHSDIAAMGVLMLPRMFALGALQLQLLVFDALASGLDAGSVTINAYARNFQSVAVGMAGVALAQSTFSVLSQAASKREYKRYWTYVRKGIYALLALTIPGGITLALLAPFAAWLVHLSHVLPVFGLCLTLYALSIPFESINHLLLRSFYAVKCTAVPAVMSVISGVVAISTSWALVSEFGVFSLALGFSAGQIVQLVGLAVVLPKKVPKAV